MRYLLAIVFAILFVVPLQATTVVFNVPPSQTAVPLTNIELDLFSSGLNGTVFSGQDLSLDLTFGDGVVGRMNLVDPFYFDVLLIVSTTGGSSSNNFASGSGYLLDESGAAVGNPQIAGVLPAFAIGLVSFTPATVHLGGYSGVHIDALTSNSGATITSAKLRLELFDSRIEFGTPAQLPEPSSLALLPLGLIGIVVAGRFRKRRGEPIDRSAPGRA